MNPKCSVIINTFNRPYMLKQAVASILCQTMDDWQCVISMDFREEDIDKFKLSEQIYDVVEDFCANDERIVYLFTDLDPEDKSINRFAYNINEAVRLYDSSKYISYLCDDDLFMPWRLSVMSRMLDENPEWQVVYGKQVIWDIPTQLFIQERPAADILPVDPEGRSPVGRVNHNSIMHRRECFEQVGGWVENAPARLGDAYFFARLNQKWPFYPVDAIGEIMRMGEQNCWSGKPQSEAEKVQVGAFA